MDELFTRQTPHSPEAEQSVLGSMLFDVRCVPDMIELLKPEDFYLPANREIFETMYAMFSLSQPIDPVTLLARMQERGVFTDASRRYIMELLSITPTAANAREYAAIIRDKALLRALLEASAEITSLVMDGGHDAESLLDLAESRIYKIREGRENQGLTHVSLVIAEAYERITELSRNPGELPGLPTGFGDLDRVIMGLNRSDLVLLGARPGMGKTSIALNVAQHAARSSGKNVVFFSLEMTKLQLGIRMLSNEASINSKFLQTGVIGEGRSGDENWIKIARASSTLSRLGILFDDDPSVTVNKMKAKCIRVKDLGLIVIDHLQLIQGSGRTENRVQEVAEISRALKIMAKELDVPVLCCAQLSRANEKRENKRPVLSDLRESGSIEQDADIVMFLYREEYYNEDPERHNLAEIIIAKNRHGETGKIDLMWEEGYVTFSSLDKAHTEQQRDALPD